MQFILGSDSITVFSKGKPYTINKQTPSFSSVLKAIKEKNQAALEAALDIKNTIIKAVTTASGRVTIKDKQIFFGDRQVTGLIATRIFQHMELGLDVKPMVNLLENLMQNPSKRAVDELLGFLEACSLPITEDGHFLAYKRVRDNYLDCHSQTLNNSVGRVLSMERNMVDEDKNNTCSYGLHFCSYDYLKSFSGERIVVLKINPADVVAIPADYNNSKGRTCRYEVVGELELDANGLPKEELEAKSITEFKGKFAPVAKTKADENLSRNDSIRNEFFDGASVTALASFYNLSKSQIRKIIKGKTR